MAPGLRVELLGPLSVTVGGRDVGPGGALRRSLLAMLALRSGEVVPVGSLVDGLWGPDPPQTATGVLQTYVSTWRKAFVAAGAGPRIDTVGAAYRLGLADGESDLSDFSRLVAEGQRLADAGRPADARATLAGALDLWRGPALVDLADRPFHAPAVRPLEERRDRIREDWAELVLRTGTGDEVAGVTAALRHLRAASPWRERTAELLMWALSRQSRQRDALEVFEQTRRRLDEELGIDPGPSLRAMQTRVLRQDPSLRTAPAAAPRRRPPRLDSFVGREGERGAVRALLDAVRLVTLTGPGGSGKTRLAEEVAADVAAGGTGTAVVALAPVEDVSLVPGAVSARLGLAAAESVDALAAQLADRPLLLVLDNLEQIPDVGAAVAGLLHGTTALRVLATSREPLRVPGEHVHPVDPLPVPPAGERNAHRVASTPSVALLLDRASDRATVEDADPAALRDIVRSLDGLPLALEIVAPWLGVVGATAVLGELHRSLDLADRRSGADERHRTLRAAIAWSHDRISPDEQRLLRRLAVLRGGGDLDAVRAVAGDDLIRPPLDVLVDLVDRNLVGRAEPVEGVPRFRLLETVRHFAGERLDDAGERAQTEVRAAEHYAAWAVGLAAHSEAADADPWLTRTVADADNLRAAMDAFARLGRVHDHLQLVVDAWALWFEVGYEIEGERRLQAALDAAPRNAPARAIGLLYLHSLGVIRDWDRAQQMVDEAIALARASGDQAVLAGALIAKGDFTTTEEQMREVSLEAAAIAERIRGEPVRHSFVSPDSLAGEAADNMSAHFTYRDVREAIRWQRRAVQCAERGRNRRLLARHLGLLTWLHVLHGDVDGAAEPCARAQSLVGGGVEGRWEDIVALSSAMLVQLRGDGQAAAAAIRDLISGGLVTGRLLLLYYGTFSLVDALVDAGELVEADAALTRVEELLGETDDPKVLGHMHARRARLVRLAGRHGEAASLLEALEEDLEADELSPWHVIYLVERAVTADDREEARTWVRRLEELSARTGIAVPPWERRLLADVDRHRSGVRPEPVSRSRARR